MSEFSTYTPEMLVYYHALSPQLQAAVGVALEPPRSIEGLASMAEQLAQNGMASQQVEF